MRSSHSSLPKAQCICRTALQKHAAFFDLNGDGLVTPMETFRACRKLGFNLFLCLLAPLLINLPFAWWTSPSWWPTLTFRIGNIHRCRHGSDSQIYDQDGNFHEDRFEQFWQRFDKDGDEQLSFWELLRATEYQRNGWDFFGWTASKLEWFFLYLLIAEKGKVRKELVRGVFDGTLFEKIEQARSRDKERKRELLRERKVE